MANAHRGRDPSWRVLSAESTDVLIPINSSDAFISVDTADLISSLINSLGIFFFNSQRLFYAMTVRASPLAHSRSTNKI